MPSKSTSDESVRVRVMLRTLRVGDRVRATVRSATAYQGATGTVTDPDPRYDMDRQRRIKVRWDDGREAVVFPTSVESTSEWVHTDRLRVKDRGPHVPEPYARIGDDNRCSTCGDIIVRKEI